MASFLLKKNLVRNWNGVLAGIRLHVSDLQRDLLYHVSLKSPPAGEVSMCFISNHQSFRYEKTKRTLHLFIGDNWEIRGADGTFQHAATRLRPEPTLGDQVRT